MSSFISCFATEFRDYFQNSKKLPVYDEEKNVWSTFNIDHLSKLLDSSNSGPELKFVKVSAVPVNISACKAPLVCTNPSWNCQLFRVELQCCELVRFRFSSHRFEQTNVVSAQAMI